MIFVIVDIVYFDQINNYILIWPKTVMFQIDDLDAVVLQSRQLASTYLMLC